MKEIVPQHLPPGWRNVSLESIVVRMSNGITKKQSKDGRGFAVSRIETISQGVVDFCRVGYLTNLSPAEIEHYRLHGGDILFSHINSDLHLGKTAVVSMSADPLLHGMNLLLIRVDQDSVLPLFLHWLFNYYRFAGLFMSIAQHAVNQSSINQAKLKHIPIVLPPLDEQREIVAEIEKQFTRLEAGVAGLRRVQANLKRYRAAVLKAACEGKLVPTEADLARQGGRTYETGAQLLERILIERRKKWNGKGRYKDPEKPDVVNLPQLPEGWTIASVDQLSSHITSGSRDWSQFYGRGSGTFILAQNVRPLFLDLSERQAVDAPEGDAETERTRVALNDLLVTIVGAKTGDVCRVSIELDDHYVCQSVALLRPVLASVSRFAELYLASLENGRAQWKRYIYGQGRPHLSFEQLRMTALLFPPTAEQERIVAEVDCRLSVVEELEAVVSANLQRATRLRQSILQRAFEGSLVRDDLTGSEAGTLENPRVQA